MKKEHIAIWRLIDIIKYDSQHYSKTDEGERVYDYHAHVSHVKDKVKAEEFDNHITIGIKEKKEESKVIYQIKIEIRNLEIYFSGSETLSFGDLLDNHEMSEICINFNNNKFTSDKWRGGKRIPRFVLNYSKGNLPLSKVSFSRNEFDDVTLRIDGFIYGYDRKVFNRRIVNLDNNKFTRLMINSSANIHLGKGNIIESLEGEKLGASSIYFSPNQRIDEEGKYAGYHKQIFFRLQKQALERLDFSQIKILHIEIMKCEHHILREDKPFKENWQDRVKMFLSYHLSRYGTSWKLLLAWLLGMNIVFLFLIYLFCMSWF